MKKSENQFSFTLAASSKSGRAKNQILISNLAGSEQIVRLKLRPRTAA